MKNNLLAPSLIFLFISIIYVFPLAMSISNWGQMDWDQFTFWSAVSRETILNYHQVPLWNPYSNGGNVLLAHPQSCFCSPFFIFILFFGPILGMKINWIIHLFFGMTGMFLLGRHFNMPKISAYFSAGIFMLCSMFTLHLTEGHTEWLVLAYLPWFFLSFRKSGERGGFLVLAVIFLSLMIFWGALDVPIVTTIFVSFYAVFLSIKKKSFCFIRNVLWVFILTILLCSIKLLPAIEFLRHNQRKAISEKSAEISMLPKILLSRDQNYYYQNTKWAWPQNKLKVRGKYFDIGWHEYGAYIGIIPLVLVMIGIFFYGKKHWPLLLTGIVCLLLSLGSNSFLNLWAVINKLPIYNQFEQISRFIAGFIFSITIFSGLGLSKIEMLSARRGIKIFVSLMVLVVFLDLMLVNYPLLKQTFNLKPVILNREDEFKNRFRDFNLYSGKSRSSMYPVFLSNSGIINAYEVIGVKKGNVKIEGEADYKGEVYLLNNRGQVDIVTYTPNRIKLEINVLEPDVLVVNQNYYPGWRMKGINSFVYPYSGMIAASVPAGKFRISLYYLPDSFIIGLVMTILTVLGIIIFLFFQKNKIQKYFWEKEEGSNKHVFN